ncbi:cytochrome P450 [Thelephora terrestris]|uniref:Cytochrome P450 n=1 Tax=Thelephora terrestris TaxID=56493 RepID=A0A9P6HJM0_9AGAM|nr:cytochrome P450 [Thelephora terrestris]
MDSQQAALAICGATAAYVLYKRYRTISISDVPGPKNPSWIYGHTWWWRSEEVTVVEKRLLEEYGTVVRWNGSLGEERLWVADPKAVHHILQGSNRTYEKPDIVRERNSMVFDWGLVAVEGNAHKRQRRAMTPAFGLGEAKALYPCFDRCSNSLAEIWRESISAAGSGQAAIIDVHSWLSKTALDVIGAGAFDYDFGALENKDNKLTKSYENLTFGAFGKPSKGRLFVMDSIKWAPKGTGAWLFNRDKSSGMTRLRENRTYVREVAEKLIEEKRQELEDGTSGKDLLSLLVKANSALRPDWRLSDEEIISQVRTIMFAGHDTTAKTMTFLLWELANKRHVQESLRAEIRETLGRIRARGDSDFTVNDFDSMPYLLAVGKEVLRVYPIATEISRAAKTDDVLPLSKPIVGLSGKVYEDLPVPAGTLMTISTVGYNLNKDLWGADAYKFRPERWLDMNEKPETPIGVYSNLATFSGGPRGCIGWRFALIELHTVLVTLVRQFDFSLPDNGQKVQKVRSGLIASGLISPVVVGEEHKGPQMPLKVTILGNE